MNIPDVLGKHWTALSVETGALLPCILRLADLFGDQLLEAIGQLEAAATVVLGTHRCLHDSQVVAKRDHGESEKQLHHG